MDRIAISPHTLSVTESGLTVKERAGVGTFRSSDEIFFESPEPFRSEMALIFSEVRFTKPCIHPAAAIFSWGKVAAVYG